MRIQKVRIVSNNIGYGPEPLTDDEVVQHLTISAIGRVWFTGYNYAGGYRKYEIGRKQQISIDKSITEEILMLFTQYCESQPLVCFATDMGLWEMTITDTMGTVYYFKGSLFGGVSVGDTDLTDYIREHIPIDDLFVFASDVLDDYYDEE